MARYIDADALNEKLKQWADINSMRGYDTAYDVVMDAMEITYRMYQNQLK